MPFDPIDFNETFPLIESEEGLRVLARALRAPMPKDFTWDFGELYSKSDSCGSIGCAV